MTDCYRLGVWLGKCEAKLSARLDLGETRPPTFVGKRFAEFCAARLSKLKAAVDTDSDLGAEDGTGVEAVAQDDS